MHSLWDTLCCSILCRTTPSFTDEPSVDQIYNLTNINDYNDWSKVRDQQSEKILRLLTPLRPILRALLLAGYCVPQIAIRKNGKHLIVWDTGTLHSEYMPRESWRHYIGLGGIELKDDSIAARADRSTAEMLYVLNVSPRPLTTKHPFNRKYAIELNFPPGAIANFNQDMAGWLLIERSATYDYLAIQICDSVVDTLLDTWRAAKLSDDAAFPKQPGYTHPEAAVWTWLTFRDFSPSPLGLLPLIFARLYHPNAGWAEGLADWSKEFGTSKSLGRLLWHGISDFDLNKSLIRKLIYPAEFFLSTASAWTPEKNHSASSTMVLNDLILSLRGQDAESRGVWVKRTARALHSTGTSSSDQSVETFETWINAVIDGSESLTAASEALDAEIVSGARFEEIRPLYLQEVQEAFLDEEPPDTSRGLLITVVADVSGELGFFEAICAAEFESSTQGFLRMMRTLSAEDETRVDALKILDEAKENFDATIDRFRERYKSEEKFTMEIIALAFDLIATIAIPTLAAGVLSVVESESIRLYLSRQRAWATQLSDEFRQKTWAYWEKLALENAAKFSESFKKAEFHKTGLTGIAKAAVQGLKWLHPASTKLSILSAYKAYNAGMFSFLNEKIRASRVDVALQVREMYRPFALDSRSEPDLTFDAIVEPALMTFFFIHSLGKLTAGGPPPTGGQESIVDAALYESSGMRKIYELAFISGTAINPDGRLAFVLNTKIDLWPAAAAESFTFLDWVDAPFSAHALRTFESDSVRALKAEEVVNMPS